MNVLYVFLIIFAVLFLISSVKISFCFEFYNIKSEKYSAYIKIGPFRYTIFPRKEKKPREAARGEKKKKVRKEKPKKEVEKPEKGKYNIRDILEFIKEPMIKLFGKFRKYLRIDIADMNIIVASGDAFKTAMIFGAVSQSAYYIRELLEHNLNAKIKSINVGSDFAGTKTKFNINLKLSIRFYQIISVSLSSAAMLVKWMARNKNKANVDVK